ncbi:MAG TPA: hypothetical protein VGI78_08830, partial [Acetobacteraceae bacterium]
EFQERDGDWAAPQWELRRARELVATLVRVQQQTDRLRAAVRVELPASSTQRQGENIHPKPMMMSRTTPSETKGIIVSLVMNRSSRHLAG